MNETQTIQPGEQSQVEPNEPSTTRKRVFLVDNPVSGTSDAEDRRTSFVRHFEENNWTPEVHVTQKDEDLKSIVRDAVARGFDLIVASGGDGTVAGVASGLARSQVPLGIIPAGTGNMLARDLGIPLRLEASLELITGEHHLMEMDAMEVNDQLYVLNLGVGLSPEVMANAGRENKRRFGMAAYVWSTIVKLTGFQLRNFYIQVDEDVSVLRASEIMVVNSSIIGIQDIQPTIKICPDDGCLDVCIVRARTALDLGGLVVNTLLRRRNRSSRFRCLQANERVVIRSDRKLPVQADGELIGETPLEVKVLPGVLRVIIPVKQAENGSGQPGKATGSNR